MIYYVTGILGAGKSYYGSKKIAEALLRGKFVATNMRLVPGWEKIVLSHSPYYKLAKKNKRPFYEEEMRRRYAWVPDMEVLVSAKLHGRGESRGVRVIDEAHNEINNREFMDSQQKAILRKMALARKRGWDDYILAQSKDNTDMALRRIGGQEIRLVNWKKLLILPFFQAEILPFNLFLALAFSMNLPGQVRRDSKVVWRQVYTLGWEKSIYDTFEDFDAGAAEEEFEDDVLWLPIQGREYKHSDFLKERASRRKDREALTAEAAEITSERKPWPPALRESSPAPRESSPALPPQRPRASRPSDESRKSTDPQNPPKYENEG